ncbi:hypothetical protein [Intestinimonas sp. HCP28S3_D6]|uniref:LptM family lipoprotein n=1 Tax=Intestinimonas sp. HCP28S3_D6 TaxID=3438942 RepID=UPI003F8C4414
MKRAASILLVGVMALSLAACGKTAKESPAPATTAPVETTAPVTDTTAPMDETTPVDETAPAETGTPNEEEHAVSGVVNKLEDYLVLVVGDDYQVFDFAKDLKVDGINEGDEVTVVYTGTLGDEKTPPVVIEIAKN